MPCMGCHGNTRNAEWASRLLFCPATNERPPNASAPFIPTSCFLLFLLLFIFPLVLGPAPTDHDPDTTRPPTHPTAALPLTMKSCLKPTPPYTPLLHSTVGTPSGSGTASPASEHPSLRKTVSFCQEQLEEYFEADDWDRTPAPVAPKLSYQ